VLTLPIPVSRALRKLGHDIKDARRRRRITMAIAAERASISKPTFIRVERAIRVFQSEATPRSFMCWDGRPAGRPRCLEKRPCGPAARRRKSAAAHTRRAQTETHERQLMDKETFVYVDLDGVPHLMGRLWLMCARTRKALPSNTTKPGWKIRAILPGAGPAGWPRPVSHAG